MFRKLLPFTRHSDFTCFYFAGRRSRERAASANSKLRRLLGNYFLIYSRVAEI